MGLQELEQACAGRQDERQPEFAAPETRETPGDQANAQNDQDERHRPDGKPQGHVAVVGEIIAERTDPVADRRFRRRLQDADGAPIVREKRDKRKERGGEEEPPERVVPPVALECVIFG